MLEKKQMKLSELVNNDGPMNFFPRNSLSATREVFGETSVSTHLNQLKLRSAQHYFTSPSLHLLASLLMEISESLDPTLLVSINVCK